jgi:hypothetical protein
MGMSLQARDGATRKALLATVDRAMSLFPEATRPASKKPSKRQAQPA